MLKKFDYDITEKMAKKIDLSDDEVEEEGDDDDTDGVLSDDSYFMTPDHTNWNRGETSMRSKNTKV